MNILTFPELFVDNRRCGMMEPFHMDTLNVCEMKLCLLSAARHTLMLLLMRPNFFNSVDAYACRTSNDIADYRAAVCLGHNWQP